MGSMFACAETIFAVAFNSIRSQGIHHANFCNRRGVLCHLPMLISTTAFAQTGNDSAASEPTVAVTKAALRSQNRQLSKAGRYALNSTKGLDAGNIAVFVKGGTVSLVGTVVDAAQIQVASHVTQGVPNVTAFDIRLIVAEDGAQ